MNAPHAVATTSPKDTLNSREWTGRFIASPTSLPVSFVFDERPIVGIPEDWQPVSDRRRIDVDISETVFEGNDARTGLNVRVEFTEYRDFPVMEWVAWFTNKGDGTAPVIRDILAMNGEFKGASPVLYHLQWRLLQRDRIYTFRDPLARRRHGPFCL